MNNKLLPLLLLLSSCAHNIEYMDEASNAPWQTPVETLERGGGNCVSFAIIDFFRLEKEGRNPFLVIGWADGQSHMWVVASGKLIDRLLPSAHHVPLIYLNRAGEYKREPKAKRLNGRVQVAKWEYLLGRMGQ